MKTYSPKACDVEHAWYAVDAKDKTLGRLASGIAVRLQGKHKPTYSRHMDMGDFMVVFNCEQVALTGKKRTDAMHYWHTGYPGGIKSASMQDRLDKRPEEVLRLAVKRMLPRGPLGNSMLRKLKIYRGDQHPHAAQQPILLEEV